MVIWISKTKELVDDLNQLFEFFGDNIKVSEVRRIKSYYRLTSKSPALLLSFLSSLQEMIPEIYFEHQIQDALKESLNS